MRIALFGTNFSENFNKYIQHLINKLESEKVEIYIEQFFLNYLKEKMRFKSDILTFTNHEDLKDKVARHWIAESMYDILLKDTSNK